MDDLPEYLCGEPLCLHDHDKDQETIEDLTAELHAEACGTGCEWHTSPAVINRMYRDKAIDVWRASR